MKKTKQKLLTGILVPTTTLCVAAGATGLVIGLKDKSGPAFLDGKNINFSAGEGKIVNGSGKTTIEGGTTFDKVVKPEVKSNNPKKVFGGWKDAATSNWIRGNQTIRNDMNMVAAYNDANSSEYVSVLFKNDPTIEAESSHPILQGNQLISVNKGYYFFMVNRPTAKWTVTKEVGGVTVTKEKYFKGWKYADTGVQVQENDIISKNVTLYPIFTEAVTITWHPHGARTTECPAGKGAIERGQESTTLETGLTFSKFNQPGLKFVDESTGEKVTGAYFAGWYKDEACTNAWGTDEEITADTEAWAKWDKEPQVGDQYGIVTFTDARPTMADGTTLPSTMSYGWTPTNSIIVKLNTVKWGDTNKPSIICYNNDTVTYDYKIYSWEYCVRTSAEEETEVWSDWTTLTDDTLFSNKNIKIRPVLTYAIDDIAIYGETDVEVEGTYQYQAIITGGAQSSNKNLVWGLYTTNDGTDTPVPEGLAQINGTTGKVTVKSISRAVWEQQNLSYFYVKVTSQLDTSKSAYYKVNISMPYTNNSYVWIHTESSESADPKWYYADIEDFCNPSATTITTKAFADKGQTTHNFNKSDAFTDTITFGTDLGAIPDNFLYEWTNFQGTVDLANSSVANIGANFMAGCTAYNTALDLNKIINIGPNFLKECTAFNSNITFNANAPLVWIDEGFLNGCTAFNSTITFPTINYFEIGNAFMFGCTSYNQDMYLPTNLLSIGDFFMLNCNAFTSKLVVNCPVDTFVVSDSTLSSTSSTADIYVTGFDVDGNNATPFKSVCKTIAKTNHYRTVNDEIWTGDVDETELKAGINELLASNNMTLNSTVTQTDGTVVSSETKYTELVTNDTLWTIAENATTGEVIKRNSASNILEDHYDKSTGNYKTTLSVNDRTSALFNFNGLRTLLNAAPLTKASWTVDSTNKWLTYTNTDNTFRITLQFQRKKDTGASNKKIVYAKYETSTDSGATWDLSSSYAISSLDSTTMSGLPESYYHLIHATYDSETTKFTASETTNCSDTQVSAFVISLENAGYTSESTLPTAFDLHTYYVPSGILGKAISSAKLFKVDGSCVDLTITTDPVTNYQLVSCPTGYSFEYSDIIIASALGASGSNLAFELSAATSLGTFTIKNNYNTNEVTYYRDEACTTDNQIDFGTAISTGILCDNTEERVFYVKCNENVDCSLWEYKIGENEKVLMSAADAVIKSTLIQTRTAEVPAIVKITITAGALSSTVNTLLTLYWNYY